VIVTRSRILNLLLLFLATEILTRPLVRNVISVTEFALIGGIAFLFAMDLLCRNERWVIQKKSVWLILFWIYLGAQLVFSIFRHLATGMSLEAALSVDLIQFKITNVGYAMPLLFLGLRNTQAIEKSIVFAMKFAVLYTFGELILSFAGFRSAIAAFYTPAGIVSEGLSHIKTLGIYRIWGVTGSTQLTGVLHALFLFWQLERKSSRLWILLTLFAIILSTSKTAYFIAILLLLLHLWLNRKTLASLTLGLLVIAFAATFSISTSNIQLTSFRQSVSHFFSSIANENSVLGNNFSETHKSPLADLEQNLRRSDYLYGAGITYSFKSAAELPESIRNQAYFTSDYYFISFLNQFGLVGGALFLLIFFIKPLQAILSGKQRDHNFVLLAFFLACLHYSPLISKLIMFIVGYSLWQVYINRVEIVANRPSNPSTRESYSWLNTRTLDAMKSI